jgi:predicted nuclease of predicted toxin-antitoxin system
MKVLLDENLPHDLRAMLLPVHEVFTVAWLGWSALENGELLAKAASDHFDVMVTKDQGIAYEQNLERLPLAVVVLHAPSNRFEDIRPLVPALLKALQTTKPLQLIHVR